MADTVALTRLGPQHKGLRMTLDEFREIEFEPGYTYELAKGVVDVAELPSVFHFLVVQIVRDALVLYRAANPSRIYAIGGGAESGLEMPGTNTRRHPDISTYLTAPPTPDAQPWDSWIPEIAVEVVSESSRHRDYFEKPEDYLAAGVRLYWIIDPITRSATVLTRSADGWQPSVLPEIGVLTTGLLPGFELRLASVFAVLPPA